MQDRGGPACSKGLVGKKSLDAEHNRGKESTGPLSDADQLKSRVKSEKPTTGANAVSLSGRGE